MEILKKIEELFESVSLFKLLNFKMDFLDIGRCNISVVIEDIHLNSTKSVHGGIHAVLADTAMGIAVKTLGIEGTTVDINIHYFEGVEMGCNLVCEGFVERSGRNIIITSGILRDALSGRTKGMARGTFFYSGKYPK